MTDYNLVKVIHNNTEYCFKEPTPVGSGHVDIFLVGGGGQGGLGNSGECNPMAAGGGGAGGYKLITNKYLYPLISSYNIRIGKGSELGCCNGMSRGGPTCMYDDNCAFVVSVLGGGAGTSSGYSSGGFVQPAGSGGSAGGGAGGTWVEGEGNAGGNNAGSYSRSYGGGNMGGGGGGAGGPGCNAYVCQVSWAIQPGACAGAGGPGKCNCFFGTCMRFAAGGGGGASIGTGTCPGGAGGQGGGGNGYGCEELPTAPTTYGSGGGGGGDGKRGTAGCQGILGIKYKTDGSWGISCESTGGYKYNCDGYTIHCFTDNDVFTPVFTNSNTGS